MELLIFIDCLRRASALRITTVIPYFGYARQDRKDEGRVPITAKLVANLLTTAGANRVLTCDLHAAQIQGFFDIPVDNLSAEPVITSFFESINDGNLVLVSPDIGNMKRARVYADVCPAILRKNPNVEITYFDMDSPLSDHKSLFARAQSYGDRFRWINPQHSGRDDGFIITQLKEIVKERFSLENKILVFDTLKKFCYMIGKDSVRNFFKLLRQLNALGATIILPAHANKYRQDGLLVPEGVGDVTSDTDNLIILERIPAEGGQYASTIVDPDKHAKVRGLFEPITFFIEKGTREVSAVKEYIKPPDLSFNPQSSAKISDDEIATGIRNYLTGKPGHVPQKELLSTLQKEGLPYHRTRGVLESLSVPEKEASFHGQVFFSTGLHNSKRYAVYGE